jgi:hypothetical protein
MDSTRSLSRSHVRQAISALLLTEYSGECIFSKKKPSTGRPSKDFLAFFPENFLVLICACSKSITETNRTSAYEAMAAINEKNTGYSIFLAIWLTDQLGKGRGCHHVD